MLGMLRQCGMMIPNQDFSLRPFPKEDLQRGLWSLIIQAFLLRVVESFLRACVGLLSAMQCMSREWTLCGKIGRLWG